MRKFGVQQSVAIYVGLLQMDSSFRIDRVGAGAVGKARDNAELRAGDGAADHAESHGVHDAPPFRERDREPGIERIAAPVVSTTSTATAGTIMSRSSARISAPLRPR